VPMLPSATCFSLVSTDVPAVAAGHAPPSMAPLCSQPEDFWELLGWLSSRGILPCV
jgi:hypothetical protein